MTRVFLKQLAMLKSVRLTLSTKIGILLFILLLSLYFKRTQKSTNNRDNSELNILHKPEIKANKHS